MGRWGAMIHFWFAGTMLAIAFVTDTLKQKIPNGLNLFGLVSGIILHSIVNGWQGLALAVTGMLFGLLPMLALYAIGAVGAGDVKLFAALGALTGIGFTLYAMVSSLWIAGIGGLLLLLWRSDRLERLKRLCYALWQLMIFREVNVLKNAAAPGKGIRFPFMWAVLPGTLYAFIQWNSF